MTVPGSLPEITFFIILVTPGVADSLAKRMVVGWQSPDHSAASRLFDALFVSLVFDASYLFVILSLVGWTGGNALDRAGNLVSTLNGGVLALGLIVLMLLTPAGIGYFASARFRIVKVPARGGKTQKRIRQVNRARATPRAWDHAAFRAYEPCFVRVRTEDGRYYGGWFNADSLVSTYPFSRDIFIAVAWNMGEFGEFECEAPNTRGVWSPMTDGCIVEWVDASPLKDKEAQNV
ncbi:DUF6338 family protein [Cryobacterium aureum]|uniref:DUF6338 family protein n=1 Tax=Cryobacterium aureum TaxID=995037 RepID=UPI000CF57091|nr:DUF6338 family protein [Cryobacterium aureum]